MGRVKEKYAQETPPGKGPGTFGYDHTTDPTARKVEQVEKTRRTKEKAAAAEQRRIDEGMLDPGVNARTLEKAQATVAQVGAKEIIRRANSGQGNLVDSVTDQAAESAMTLKTALDDLGKRAYDDPEAMPLLVEGMTTFFTALRNSGKFMQASQTRFKSEAQKVISKAQDLLYTPPVEFREMRSQAGPVKQAQMDEQWLAESQRNAAKVKRMLQNDKGLKKYLGKKGASTDMRSLLESDDPIVAAKVASAVSAARATNADKALQWMINWGMLGQLTTQSVNLVSTPAFFLYKAALLRPVEAALNSALSAVGKGSAENAQWGEFSQMAQQMGYGLKQALVNANMALLLGGSYKSKPRGDSVHAATYSKFPRGPSIFLAVMDELNTGMIRPMLAASHAYRTGKQLVAEGKLEASKLNEYVRREATTEGSDADIQGLLEARHIAANEEMGSFSKWIHKGTNIIPGGKLLNPFQHTAGNLTKMAYTYSPLSTPATLLKLTASGKYRRSPKALEEASAMLMSWGATAVAAQLLNSDSITGTYTGYSKTAERQFENGIVPPYHMKIGDRWWNYGRVDPVSKILALGVDVTKAYKAGKAEQANKTWRTLISAAYSPIRDNSAFTGFKFLMDMIEQPERTAELMAGKLQDIALLAIPSFTRNSLNNFDEKQRESRNYEKTLTHEWFQEQFGRITAEKMGAKLGMPKVDVFGNFIFKDEAPGQSGALHSFLSGLERSVLPIGASIPDKKIDRAADWFRKYNASVDYPESYWPQPLDAEYVDNTGEKKRMTPEQLVHARILAGREFHTQMMALTANGNPSVADVRASHANANAYGRAVALQKYPKPE